MSEFRYTALTGRCWKRNRGRVLVWDPLDERCKDLIRETAYMKESHRDSGVSWGNGGALRWWCNLTSRKGERERVHLVSWTAKQSKDSLAKPSWWGCGGARQWTKAIDKEFTCLQGMGLSQYLCWAWPLGRSSLWATCLDANFVVDLGVTLVATSLWWEVWMVLKAGSMPGGEGAGY